MKEVDQLIHDYCTKLLNVLKSYKTNNHVNEELKTTFFITNVMIKASNEEQGTVAGLVALTKNLDDAAIDRSVTMLLIQSDPTAPCLYIFIYQLTHCQDKPINFHGEEKTMWFAWMRWFKPWSGETSNLVWNMFSTVDVHLWELGEYQDRDCQLPLLIEPDWIVSQLE
ncbi:hypothetical protein BDR06DRAFT_971949 [Suillus hirtellus]|nr:hypothetical protein BDR06DRAFT_971949 [Suillus hirtellus]